MRIETLSRIACAAMMLSACLQEVPPLPPDEASRPPEPARKTIVTSAASEFVPSPALAGELAACKAELADMGGRKAALETENAGLVDRVNRLTAQAARLEGFEKQLADEMQTGRVLQDRLARLEQEVTDSRADAQRLNEALQTAQKQVADTQAASQQQIELAEQEISRRKAALAETTRHLDTLDQDKQRIAAALANSQRRLEELTTILSAEQHRAAGLTQENQRLDQAYGALKQSLEAELADRDLKLRQAQSRIVVTILDHVLFASGQATLKPAGMKVLDQLSTVLKKIDDKEIHVEGHTDNRPIRGPLAKRFATNWELSSARATTVVRYLIEQAGLPANILSAVGYADTKPVGPNDTEQSRAENRRIEILLYPKGLPKTSQVLN